MRFENRRETKTIPPLYVGVHINPEVIDKEWVHGRLKFEKTKRSHDTKTHIDLCPHCQEVEAKKKAEDQNLDWKSRGIPVGDRD